MQLPGVRSLLLLAGLSVCGVLAGIPAASAHHSFAMFDRTKEVKLDGTVKEWQFTNPHSWLQLFVIENGTPVEYGIEGSSVNTLLRIGWGPKTFKPGDKVSVIINPLRDGTKAGAFVKATLPDGRILSSGQTPN
ncbi:MAG: hypothetical protein JWM63_1039 [Gammaproteobacteria bacterium]|jgi:hypothetical protein|nr:hypothetical protein [Gammaproteobacteria bacterium]